MARLKFTLAEHDAFYVSKPMIAMAVLVGLFVMGAFVSLAYWILNPGASEVFLTLGAVLPMGAVVVALATGVAIAIRERRS